MRWFLVAALWLAGAGVAAAQSQPAKVAISASLIDAWLARGEVCCQSNPSLPTTGIGGSAVGVVFGIDITAWRRLGIDAEISTSGHGADYQEAVKYHARVRHRDTILSGLVRVRLRPGSTVRVEPVAGAGVAFADTLVSTSRQEFVPVQHYGDFGDYVPWVSGRTRPAVSFGVDVPIGRGRVAVAPTLRVHYTFREEVLGDQVGLGHWAVRSGVGVRIAF